VRGVDRDAREGAVGREGEVYVTRPRWPDRAFGRCVGMPVRPMSGRHVAILQENVVLWADEHPRHLMRPTPDAFAPISTILRDVDGAEADALR